MNRRQLLQAGALCTGGVLTGQAARAELKLPSTEHGIGSGAPELPYKAGEQLQIDTHEIYDYELRDASIGIEDWGDIGRGVHIREFSVPPNTHLVLGHVQEAGHYGAAIYETLEISLNQVEWSCRVVWRMDWYLANPLRTYFYWTRHQGAELETNHVVPSISR